MQDWLGTTTIEVDELGRAKKVVDFEGKAVGYEWNELGQREKTIYPDESEVLYQYNASGRLSSVQSASGTTQYRYDAMGRLAQRILPDNTTTSYEFNPLGKITSLTHEQSSKEVLDEFRYSYDPVGNITQIEKQRVGMESGLFQYTYDPLSRLVEAVHGEQRKRYNYDSLGNRISTVQDGNVVQHAYNARNQLIQTEQGKMVQDYRYDGRGNLIRTEENGQLKARYTYDATNMMVSAFTAGKGSAEYSYNGLRNRVKKLETLHNLGNLPNPCKELHYTLDLTLPYNNLLATQGAQNQNFIWGNDLIETEGEDNYYYLQDHLGSPIRLLDGQGTGTPLDYDEFGVPLAGTGKSSNPFGFTGYQADEVTGLYYAQARYYDAGLGRFGAVDPVHSGMNGYIYCNNKPLILWDPSGRIGEKIRDFFTSIFGFEVNEVEQIDGPTVEEHFFGEIETGVNLTGTVGGESRPITFFCDRDIDEWKFSTAGIRITISGFTYEFSMGLDDLGSSLSFENGEITTSWGLRINLWERRYGFEHSITTQINKLLSGTAYTNASFNERYFLTAVLLAYAAPAFFKALGSALGNGLGALANAFRDFLNSGGCPLEA